MDELIKRAALLAVAALAGCRRLPEGFPPEFLDTLKELDEGVVPQCDALIASGTCFDTDKGQAPSPAQPYLHFPADPFHGSPLVIDVDAYCSQLDLGGTVCTTLDDYQLEIVHAPCDKLDWIPGWEGNSERRELKNRIMMTLPRDPSCPRWLSVKVQRVTPAGNLAFVSGQFWLSGKDAHPVKRFKLWRQE